MLADLAAFGPVTSTELAFDKPLARIWDVKSGAPLVELKGHTDYVSQASFSHDARLVVTASHDGTVRIWDAEFGKELRKIQQKDSFVADAAFSPDDRQIIIGGGDDRAYIWQVQADAEPIILHDHSGAVQSAMFSADGRRWDSATLACVQVY
jgi:WD40 repeat protein